MEQAFNFSPDEIKKFKQALSERKSQLPITLEGLKQRQDVLRILTSYPDVTSFNTIQEISHFINVNCPELCGRAFLEECRRINRLAIYNRKLGRIRSIKSWFKKDTSEEAKVLKLQAERLNSLSKASKNEGEIIHDYSGILANLFRIDISLRGKIVALVSKVCDDAIAETETIIANYQANKNI